MDRRAALEFRARWRRVDERERAELREQTLEHKFAQLCALVDSAIALGWRTTDDEEIAAVRERWRRLRDAYRDR